MKALSLGSTIRRKHGNKEPDWESNPKASELGVIFITTWAITSTLAKLLISWKQEGKKVTGLLVEQEKIASGPFLFLFFQELKKFRTSSTTFWSTSLGLIPSLIITTGMVGCYEFQQYPWALVVVKVVSLVGLWAEATGFSSRFH